MHIRFSAAVLSLLILISSIGIAVDIHRCGDQVVSIGLFADAAECQGACESFNDIQFEGLSISKASCCSESQLYDKLETEATSQPEMLLTKVAFESFTMVENAILRSFWIKKAPWHNPQNAPPPEEDLNIYYQVFLI